MFVPDIMSSIVASVRDVFDGFPTWAKYACAGGALILVPKIAWTIRNKLKGPRKTPYKEDWTQGIIYVYQWPRMPSLPTASPYGLKLETWLRMAELQYENVKILLSLRSKEGTLPFVEMNGVEYADSGFIIRDLGKLLGKEQAMENADKLVDEVMEGMSLGPFAKFFLRFLFVRGMSRMMKDVITKVGIGRHSREDIIQIGLEDMKALSHYLGAKVYLMGDKPTKVDAAAFGFLAQARYFTKIDSPHAQLMNENEYSNLGRYCDRIRERFWPDWKQIGETLELNTHL